MGCDAFALNVISVESWSTTAVQYLFDAAQQLDFKLFFSFDMINFTNPSQFIPLLLLWYTHATYYYYNNLPFVSTFYGGTLTFGEATPDVGWQRHYHDQLAAQGVNTYFVPSFSDAATKGSEFFDAFPNVDGVMNWDSVAWESEGKNEVSSAEDEAYIQGAVAAKKTFMMGICAFQFKHLDPNENWYRRGELTLAQRISQILDLQPDFVQIQTWNDPGESTYIGNIWPSATEGSPSHAYTDGFDHSGWQILLKAFLAAYKSGARSASDVVPTDGKNAQGVFWYRPILATASCYGDSLGKPQGWENADDAVNVAILLSGSAIGATVNVYSGDSLLKSFTGAAGLNSWSVLGMRVGAQKVEVVGTDGSVLLSKEGDHAVMADATVCNFNYAVVPL
jgi:glucan endo-1,3-alpha-glucosidase